MDNKTINTLECCYIKVFLQYVDKNRTLWAVYDFIINDTRFTEIKIFRKEKQDMLKQHPVVNGYLNELDQKFPGKSYITLDEYAVFFNIKRTYAPEHFRNNNKGFIKIPHTRIGRKVIIEKLDLAYWLARHKIIDGKPIKIPELKTDGNYKRARGFTF